MTDATATMRRATLNVPPATVHSYLHDPEALVAIIPKVELASFETKDALEGKKTSEAEGVAVLSIGKIPVRVTLITSHDSGVVTFDGNGKVAKIAPFSFRGQIIESRDGSEILVEPQLDKLPEVLKRLVAKVEDRLIEVLKTRVESYYQASAGSRTV